MELELESMGPVGADANQGLIPGAIKSSSCSSDCSAVWVAPCQAGKVGIKGSGSKSFLSSGVTPKDLSSLETPMLGGGVGCVSVYILKRGIC